MCRGFKILGAMSARQLFVAIVFASDFDGEM